MLALGPNLGRLLVSKEHCHWRGSSRASQEVQAPSLFGGQGSLAHSETYQHHSKPDSFTAHTMGVQPQITLPQVQEQVTKPRTGSPLGKHHASRWHRHHEVPVPVGPLPEEAQQLKEKILRTNKVKLTRFSLSHMKKRVVPPVDIPKEMNSHRALSMTVAGRSVPLTRCMWDNTKRKTHHMEQISESYPLHCTLFR